MVKFRVLRFNGPGSVPRCGPTPLVSGHAAVAARIQNRGRLTQMLVQGQSSSPEKRKFPFRIPGNTTHPRLATSLERVSPIILCEVGFSFGVEYKQVERKLVSKKTVTLS